MPDEKPAISGISNTINPGLVSNLALSGKTAFRVRFNGQTPAQKDLYWRGPVFWETNGQAWTLTPPKKSAFEQASPAPKKESDYHYTLMMEPHQQFWLYALDLPADAPHKSRLTHDHQLILDKKLHRNITFDIRSTTQRNATSLSDSDRKRALALPDNTDSRIFALVDQWAKNASNKDNIIQQALQFYNNEFYYTLRPPSLGKDPVAEFLFDSKRGFCGHFATSFATLMRAAKIPTRLIGGYQGGIYNEVGDFYNIRQADAHVWAEVWLEKKGWVRVDPTAAIAPRRIEQSIDPNLQQFNRHINFELTPPEGIQKWAQQLKWVINSVDYYWQNAVLAYGPEKQLDFLSNFGIVNWQEMILWLAVFSGLILLGSISALFLLKNQLNDPVQTAYLTLCKKLARKTGPRHPYETATDYFNRAIKNYPNQSKRLLTLQTLYLNARYGKGGEDIFIENVKRFISTTKTP
jgi:Transglutaminase-like enzymes, putative cysteine proteases